MGIAASDEEVISALTTAGLGEHLTGLTEGLATAGDDQGSKISGGQRQRLRTYPSPHPVSRRADLGRVHQCRGSRDTQRMAETPASAILAADIDFHHT